MAVLAARGYDNIQTRETRLRDHEHLWYGWRFGMAHAVPSSKVEKNSLNHFQSLSKNCDGRYDTWMHRLNWGMEGSLLRRFGNETKVG
eukprot:scaffold2257_cov169-Amphora_coffeaeformis.AAC.6